MPTLHINSGSWTQWMISLITTPLKSTQAKRACKRTYWAPSQTATSLIFGLLMMDQEVNNGIYLISKKSRVRPHQRKMKKCLSLSRNSRSRTLTKLCLWSISQRWLLKLQDLNSEMTLSSTPCPRNFGSLPKKEKANLGVQPFWASRLTSASTLKLILRLRGQKSPRLKIL